MAALAVLQGGLDYCDQAPGRRRTQLYRNAGSRPSCRIHEFEDERLLHLGVKGVVVDGLRPLDREPAVGPLGATRYLRYLYGPCAHTYTPFDCRAGGGDYQLRYLPNHPNTRSQPSTAACWR